MAEIKRETKETRVHVTLARGTGDAKITMDGPSGREADLAFVKHMFGTFAKWSGLDLVVDARSKDDIDHHLVEDVAIAIGQALKQSVDHATIQRVGEAHVPMDEALVFAAVDLVNRPYYVGELPDPMMEHLLRSIAMEAGATLHVVVMRGRDKHHIVEGAFKATARAIGAAIRPREGAILSTKGEVDLKKGAAADRVG